MRRRTARRLGRRDHRHGTPLILLADDRYPGETVEALARWIYRYRSDLAPLALAAAAWLAGAYLHVRHPRRLAVPAGHYRHGRRRPMPRDRLA
jgi:hypothetical protein